MNKEQLDQLDVLIFIGLGWALSENVLSADEHEKARNLWDELYEEKRAMLCETCDGSGGSGGG